jgi:PAS domain S-box-containing protein
MKDTMARSGLQDRRLKAEREVERIFEMSPALLAVAGLDGYLRRFNPAFEVFGYSREELLSRPWIEFAHPDDRERMLEAAAALERGSDVVEVENRVVCRDGSARWVKWSTRVVPEEGLFYAAGRDVTESRRVEEEQAGLRRMATLVARETAPEAVFAGVAQEVCQVLGVDATQLGRYDGDRTVVAVAHWGRYPGVPIGARFSLEGDSVSARVLRTGRPARIDDYGDLPGVIPDTLRRLGIRSAIGVPISVEGRTWGVMTVTSKRDPPFPAETASRLQDFTELVATAISNATAHDKVRALADEQAALRRVATLVAREPPPAEIFAAVAGEVAALLGVEDATIFRFEDDETGTVVADKAGERAAPLDIGSRLSLEGDSATARVRRTGRPSRLDDFSNATGPLAEYTRDAGIGSSVASPIVVNGRLWGAVVVATRDKEPLPQTTEARIGQFTELVGTAIANVQARADVARLADEQAALRRVATVVARGAAETEVFTAIAKECGGLFGTRDIGFVRFESEECSLVLASSGVFREAFPPGSRTPLGGDNATTRVYRTGKPVRIDDYSDSATGLIGETARGVGVRSVVATPVVVDDRLWGAMVIGTSGAEPLPPDTELRVAQFTELMATAIANTESRARADLLADEQAALRRVATLVAQGVEADELFAAVTKEFAGLFPGVPSFTTNIVRFDPGPEFVLVGTSAPEAEPPLDWRWPPMDFFASTRVWRTGRSAQVDATELDAHSGSEVESLRRLGFLYQAGSPIIVEGQLWGALTVDSGLPLPPDTGARLERFTEFIATAIANIESREELSELADEQAALSRVATLVAEGVEPAALFAAVTKEVERLFLAVSPSALPSIIRFDPGPEFVLVGTSKDQLKLPLGSRWGLKDLYASTRVFLSGTSVRVEAAEVSATGGPDSELLQEQGFLYQIGSPIIVEGQLWGAMTINSTDELPHDTEKRLEKFTELVVTAIANSESRAGLRRLAEEQAGLRRVATLVAEGAPPREVFDAVIVEVGAFIGADNILMSRYENEREVTVLAHRGPMAAGLPAGTRVSFDGDNIHSRVHPTRRPARIEWALAHGTIARIANQAGVRAGVGVPVIVEGELWGVMVAGWTAVDSAPAGAESQMAKFIDLLETAIANADTRDQLKASRVRVLTEADDARRRVVRDLHDGAQQRLVHSIITVKLAQRALAETDSSAAKLLDEALAQAEQANVELRELAHGILPPVLTRGGLRAGVDAVVSRIDLPVKTVDITGERFAAEIEASAYFIVAEALTNVVKHAQATAAEVKAWVEDGELRLEIVDDGVGGADVTGHGLLGLSDRATVLGGSFGVGMSPSGGTVVMASLPL